MRTSQQDMLEQVLACFRNLQESQSRVDGMLHSINNRLSTSRELIPSAPSDLSNEQHFSWQTRSENSNLATANTQPSAILGVRVQQVDKASCQLPCQCQCHLRGRWRTHRLLDHFIGSLFVGYSRTPRSSLPCSTASCARYQSTLVSVIYVFPQWFLQHILSIILAYNRPDGPALNLRTFRVISDSSKCFWLAATGNVAEMRDMFKKGEASPFDVSSGARQATLLMVCTFLDFQNR